MRKIAITLWSILFKLGNVPHCSAEEQRQSFGFELDKGDNIDNVKQVVRDLKMGRYGAVKYFGPSIPSPTIFVFDFTFIYPLNTNIFFNGKFFFECKAIHGILLITMYACKPQGYVVLLKYHFCMNHQDGRILWVGITSTI